MSARSRARSRCSPPLSWAATFQAIIGYAESPTLRIRADENLLPLIRSEVKNGRLVLRIESRDVEPSEPIRVTALTPRLEAVCIQGSAEVRAAAMPGVDFTAEVSGSSTLTVEEIDAATVTLDVSGASSINPRGRADSLTIIASGSSNLDGTDFTSDAVTLDVSGSSTIIVHAVSSTRGSVSGASLASILGSPSTRAVTTSGAAAVTYDALGDPSPHRGP